MATYVNDLRLKEIATGDESGTWGTSTNTNLELIAEAFSYSTVATFDTDADKTETIADGSTDPYRSIYVKVTSGVSLTATRTLTIAPNTVSKIFMIENATSGSQSISISQGSGANVTIPNGDVKVIYTDGAGAGAAVVDAFANLKVTDAAQTNITSVGTLSSLTVSGDATFDTDTLYVDSTNNRIGIGTTSPSHPLHVSGASGATQAFFNTTSGNTNLQIKITEDAGTVLISKDSTIKRNLSFQIGDDEVMRIDTNDRVGIGTTSPSVPLEVNSGGDNIGIKTTSSDANAFMSFEDSDAVNGPRIGSVGNDFIIQTSLSERVRVDSTGDVGIGTSSPERALHVVGSAVRFESQDAGAAAGPTLELFRNSASPADGDDIGQITFRGEDDGGNITSYAGILGEIVDVTGGTEDGRLRFLTATAGGFTEKLRIEESGYVGIGTTNPSSTLHLKAADNNDTTLTITGGVTAALGSNAIIKLIPDGTSGEGVIDVDGSDGYDQLELRTGGATALTIDGSQNVGIGTTSPDSELHIAGSAGSAPKLSLSEGGARSVIYATRNSDTNGDLRFQTEISGTIADRMIIDYSGNVGIGDTTPNSKLDVVDSTVGNVVASFTDLGGGGGASNKGLTIGTESDGGSIRTVGTSGGGGANMSFKTANSERMRVTADGFVGIGTDSPVAKLTVYDATTNGLLKLISGDPDANMSFEDNSTTDTVAVGCVGDDMKVRVDAGNITFFTGSAGTASERMRIDDSGVLCHGTTSATSLATFETITANKMHVQGGSSGGTSPVVHFSDADGTVEGNSTILSIGFDNDTSFSNANYIRFIDQTAEQGVIEGAGAGSVTYTTSSDKRRKENIEDAPNYLEKIKQIGVKKYNFIGSEKKEVGMLAQDLYEIIPEPVKVGGDDENSNPWGIDYGKLTPFLIKAIQEQQEQIESLKSEIELLKGGQ